MSQHTSWPALDRYTRDLLDGPERLAVEAHVHECSDCAGSLGRLRDEEEALRDALEPEEADDEAVAGITSLALQTKGPATPRRWGARLRDRFGAAGALIPLAAAAAVIVAVIATTAELPSKHVDPIAAAVIAVERGEGDAAALRLGRKCLPELVRAEALAQGAARERLAVVRRQIENSAARVLWIEHGPRAEMAKLAPMMLRDHAFLVQTLTLETRQNEFSGWCIALPFRAPIQSFPTRELADYDVVMLGDIRSSDASLPRSLDDFVSDDGGGLLMIAGQRTAGPDSVQAMCTVSPVERAQARGGQEGSVRLTPIGEVHAATRIETAASRDEFFGAMAKLRWVDAVQPRAGAQVLVETREGAPTLTTWEVGHGRVAYLASDDQWNWIGQGGPERTLYPYYKAILNYLAGR